VTLWSRLGTRARGVLVYGASRSASQSLLGLRGLLLAALVGPAGFGAWSLFRLFGRYARLANIGLFRGLEYRLAQAPDSEQHRPGEGREWARAAVGFLLLVFGGISLVLGLVSFLVADPLLRAAMRGLAAALVFSELAVYALVCLRARGRLDVYARLEVVHAAFHVLGALLGALGWGVVGAFYGYAAASLASAAVLLRQAPWKPRFDMARIRGMVSVGFPVMLASSFAMALATADRFVVAGFGGLELLGQYAFGTALAGLATSAAWTLRTVIFPDVYGQAARTDTHVAVRDHLEETILPFARVYSPLLGLAALALGPVVVLLVPQYTEAIGPARIFLFTGVTYGFAVLGSLALVAAGRQKRLPGYSGAALVLNVLLSLGALLAGLGITGVAFAALISRGLYGLAILGTAASAARIERAGRYLVRAAAPVVYCTAVVWLLGRVLPPEELGPSLVAILAYAVLVSPLARAAGRDLRRLVTSG
jgi:O-antigen/teichoic acid export membrane protein